MHTRHPHTTTLGFTLLELLIAIAIFTVIGAMALGGYNELITQHEHTATNMARIRAVQLAVTRMAQDFEQLEPRPIRDATAQTVRAALLVNNGGTGTLEFTRAGWTNPAGVQRSALQRVQYLVTDGKLKRIYWPALDSTLNTQPIEVTLVDKVTRLDVRLMDQNRLWQTTWPTAGASARTLPLAVEFTLQLEDWGEIKRVVEVP